MKRIIVTSFFFAAFIFMSAQNTSWNWTMQGKGYYKEFVNCLATDQLGNIYAGGSANSFSTNFQSVSFTNTPGGSLFIIKYDPAGNILWSFQNSGTGNAGVRGLAVDGKGDLYVAGQFSGSISISGYNFQTAGNYDIFLFKMDPAGNILWATAGNGSLVDNAWAVAADANGNAFLTGEFSSPALVFGNTTLLNNTPGNYSFMMKFNSSGNVVWAGASPGQGRAVTVDNQGNSFFAGYYGTTMVVGSFTLSNAGNQDFYLVKYDPAGQVLWAKNGSGPGSEQGLCLATDASNVYLGGYTTSTLLPIGSLSVANTGSNNSTAFVLKYSPGGIAQWVRSSGSTVPYGICTDVAGNLLLAGTFNPTLSFTNGTITTNGASDVFVTKFDASGNELVSLTAGGSGPDVAVSITTDYTGEAFVSGYFVSPSLAFGASTLLNSSAVGYEDAFITKLSSCTITPAAPTDVTPLNLKSVCVNNSTSLTVSGPAAIRWYSSGSYPQVLSTAATFVTPPLSIGTHTFYAESVGCTRSASRTAVIVSTSPCLGLEDKANVPGTIRMYPNPASTEIQLEVDENSSLKIYSVSGELLTENSLTPGNNTITLPQIRPGLYMAVLAGSRDSRCLRLVIQ